MPRTRHSDNKYDNLKKAHSYKQQPKKYYDVVHALMQSFSENNTKQEILVPLNSKIQMEEEELQSKSFIMMGPGHCGKTSTIKWLTRFTDKQIIWIDCKIYITDSAIINEMLEGLSCSLSRHLSKDLVVKGAINFKELSKVLHRENKRFVIILKNPEKLAEQMRPLLIYNILEWINSNTDHDSLQFIIATRDIGFVDRGQKRVKSRMNIPLIYIGRPTPTKVKQILAKRIEDGFNQVENYTTKDKDCAKLLKSLQQKEVDKILVAHYDCEMRPISYYLKIMQLILAINIESAENLSLLCSNQKELFDIVLEGFQTYNMYITDHKVIARHFFKISHLPEIILMGLFRSRYLRQKEGSYTSSITLAQLMKDYNHIKSRVKLQEGGSSFLYSQHIMEGALRNLINWAFLAFAKSSQRMQIFGRQITSRYGPEDIQSFYKECENIPNIVKAIYSEN